jgi:hypothetical protein
MSREVEMRTGRPLAGLLMLTLALPGAACRRARSGPPTGDSASAAVSAGPDTAAVGLQVVPDTTRRQPKIVIALPEGGLPRNSPALAASLRGRARAELVELATSAGRDTAALGEWARSRAPQLRFCFTEYGLKADSTLAGRLRVWARTDSAGQVTETTSKGSGRAWRGPRAQEVERCASERVRSWRYHPLTLGADTVAMTWRFSVAPAP